MSEISDETRADDSNLRQLMRAIAQERHRFGYRRLHVLLKRTIGTRAPMLVPMIRTTGGRSTLCQTNSPTAAPSAS